jgi:hypothetical protein
MSPYAAGFTQLLRSLPLERGAVWWKGADKEDIRIDDHSREEHYGYGLGITTAFNRKVTNMEVSTGSVRSLHGFLKRMSLT